MLGTSVTYKGQVTIPKEVRDALHINRGDRVYFVADGDRAIMVPVKGDFWSLRGVLKKYAKGKAGNWKSLRKEMQKDRAARQVRILDGSRGGEE